MSYDAVDSAALASIRYAGGRLYLKFHTSDTVYVYRRVPAELVRRFLRAESLGAFYNRYIRGKYQ